jgi:hypothetical protein
MGRAIEDCFETSLDFRLMAGFVQDTFRHTQPDAAPASGCAWSDSCRFGLRHGTARELPNRDVDAVPEVYGRHAQDQCGERAFVEMALGFVPDVVRDRIAAIAQARGRFG